ncbi:MAG: phospho-N-acetylmuramoyl-pentapeptide-transferase [Candidatus Amulumruptor caecigallinarius]|nr:phospho-N-acetylmuramoyl-pentapeptide-transferase [Candidatus Amulumruptor caecigallinarius]
MLYWLSQILEGWDFPGHNLMNYISFRAGVTFALSLLIGLVFGHKIIARLQKMQIGEEVRNLGLEGQLQKKGTPTMGGIIIILAILVPCLLLGNLRNIYMLLMITATVWMGVIGFLDDYRKLKFHNKDGLKGKYKVTGQVGLGLLVGITMWLSPSITMSENFEVENVGSEETEVVVSKEEIKSPQTTIPFVKNNNFNYMDLTSWISDRHTAETLGWLVFVLVVVVVVTAVSNGANLTDGIDGLCAGTSAIIGVALLIMGYLGGNIIYASYLNIMYIPGSEELVVFAAAFIGALVGFLWYNAYPAQVFMGDTGSLTLGGILAVFAILIRKELLIPMLCLIFFLEDLSVILQVGYFKYTKKKYGEGRRIFKMTPLHHHFQRAAVTEGQVKWNRPVNPIAEPKIVTRFWIVGILLAALTFVTLKIR